MPTPLHSSSVSLRLNEFPSHWKVASVVPIYKNGPRDEASNYRPISLLPSISKVLESLINSHIVAHLEQNQLLSPVQFGFRAKRSTCDLLATLTQKWNDTMDNGGSNIIVTLDFSKAFDRVWHEGLLSKLPSYFLRDKWSTTHLADQLSVQPITIRCLSWLFLKHPSNNSRRSSRKRTWPYPLPTFHQ